MERIIILFFALVLAFNLTIAGSVATEMFYVDDDGPVDLTTIQAALDNASSGDEIVVRPGTYTENVYVDKDNITIRSDSGNPFDTIVKANSSSDHVFHVTANRVKISGFNIKGASGLGNGIYLEKVEYCLIENNELSNNDHGIYLNFSSNSTLENNGLLNNDHGIYLDSSSSNTLENNTANSNTYGIYLDSSSSNTLSNNTASNNHYGIGLYSSSNSILSGNRMQDNKYNFCSDGNSLDTNIVYANNSVDGKPIYYLIEVSNLEINSSSNAGTVYLIDCKNIIVKDLTIEKEGYGILLYNTTDSKLENNTASYNSYGIRLTDSSNDNTLSKNTASNNINYGIYLCSSSSNTLENNKADSNNDCGIYLDYSSDNTLNNNHVLDNSDGIFLEYSDENTLTGNTVNSNERGIYLTSSSNNCIYNNDFNNNNNAFFSGTNPGNIWNTARTPGSNIIDGPYLGGNFWATPTKDGFSQTHKDKDGDGICDVTYNLGEGNIDYLPLLIPSSPPPVPNPGPIPPNPWGVLKYVTENFTISFEYLKIGNSKPPNVIVNESISFEVSAPSDEIVYKNVTIQVGEANFSSNESNFRNATIEFRVEKSWIEENNINNATINLYRYSEGEWNDLKSPKVSEDEDFIYFKAKTPGFSLFTICGKERLPQNPGGIGEWEYLQKNVTANFTISLEYLDTGYSNPPVIIVNESASSEFSAPPWEIVYKIVNIQVGEANFSSDESNFRNETIEFRVEKSWIEENNINEDKIYLKRYSEEKWDKLETSKIREDADYIYYVAETPGFSVFGIFASTLKRLLIIYPPVFLLIICLGKFFVSREKDQDEK